LKLGIVELKVLQNDFIDKLTHLTRCIYLIKEEKDPEEDGMRRRRRERRRE
jgi:hypothetical protein